MATRTVSPGFRNWGGFIPAPTPAGVPVAMMSPGDSVTHFDTCAGEGEEVESVELHCEGSTAAGREREPYAYNSHPYSPRARFPAAAGRRASRLAS